MVFIFQMSTIPTYQKINAFMESAKPSVYTKSNGEGLERVKKEDGMYAYFMEAASIEYNVERWDGVLQSNQLFSWGFGEMADTLNVLQILWTDTAGGSSW